MRYQPLPPEFHAANRRTLAATLGDEAIAIIDTADVLIRSGDFEYPFRPDSNFYYLTGIAEPEAVLVLVPGHSNPNLRELLFLSGTSEFISTWEGDRLTPTAAQAISGVKSIFPLTELEPMLDRLAGTYATIFLNAEASLRSHQTSPALRRARELRHRLPLHHLKSALPQLARQRQIKQPAEIEQLRRAIAITKTGLQAAFAATRPGRHEYELEAELTASFLRQGSNHAFTPIIASGHSSTVLHHMRSDGLIPKTGVVLLDVGAEYGFYTADISRTIPATGTFNDRQHAVYSAVRRIQQHAITLLKPGAVKRDYELAVGEQLRDELVKLGLKDPNPRVYQPHATSHFLGLDVHDVGDYSVPLEPGMVLTVEPGIYLKDESLGVRLEDDILITETGCEVLSKDIPSDPAEIEKILPAKGSS